MRCFLSWPGLNSPEYISRRRLTERVRGVQSSQFRGDRKGGWKMRKNIFAGAWVVAALLLGLSFAVQAAEVNISDQPPQSITIRNLSVKDGEVSGEIVNSSSRLIRDVQLLIRYTWLWKNEM